MRASYYYKKQFSADDQRECKHGKDFLLLLDMQVSERGSEDMSHRAGGLSANYPHIFGLLGPEG